MPRNVIVDRFCSAARTGHLVYLGRREVKESQSVLRDIRGNGSVGAAILNIITVRLISLKRIVVFSTTLIFTRHAILESANKINI